MSRKITNTQKEPENKEIKLVYNNAQGIKSKRASILQIINELNPDMCAFTETRLAAKG